MKKLLVFLLAMMAMVTTAPLMAKGVNMKKYITLTVKSGEDIGLDFKATQANTPVRIVSGGNTQNIIVNNTWYVDNNPYFTVTADGTTMTIYGELDGINCPYNFGNLTSLDVSKNPQLTTLSCHSNKFTTESMNELYCSLPDRQGREKGKIYPLYEKDDANHETIAAATSDNARNKNWQVRYSDGTEVPSKGNYKCK